MTLSGGLRQSKPSSITLPDLFPGQAPKNAPNRAHKNALMPLLHWTADAVAVDILNRNDDILSGNEVESVVIRTAH